MENIYCAQCGRKIQDNDFCCFPTSNQFQGEIFCNMECFKNYAQLENDRLILIERDYF
ncbi:hypothetical protein R5P91_08715 [Oenococcus oeni]